MRAIRIVIQSALRVAPNTGTIPGNGENRGTSPLSPRDYAKEHHVETDLADDIRCGND